MNNWWTFHDFITDAGRGRNKIREWLDGLPEEARATIDAKLRLMQITEKWSTKWTTKLEGIDNIWELRIPYDKVQYRPLYARDRDKLILLAGTIEKSGKMPKGDLKAAQDRFIQWRRDSSHAKPHQFDGD